MIVGFAISTVFWYYERPIPAYLVLLGVGLARHGSLLPGPRRHDLLPLPRPVPRHGGEIPAAGSRRSTWPIGERYRQERLRAEQLEVGQRRGHEPTPSSVEDRRASGPDPIPNRDRDDPTVDERRARIHDDLRGVIEGELLFEPIERAPYAHDASLYEIDPLGVVVPRTEHDVVLAVRYAAENSLPIHPRGAGTGVAGETLGPGLVIDFSRHFRRIVDIRPEEVVVQPGVVLDVLNAQLAPLGRRLGPDPDRSEACTIGGMIGVDAGGPRSLRYGTTGDHVESLRVVFANGEIAEVGDEPWPCFDDEPHEFKDVVVQKLGALVRRSGETIARKAPKSARNRAGYALKRAATSEGIHLGRLLAGSEGTLALVTEATLRTVPIPSAQGVAILPFGRIGDAAATVLDCLDAGPSACDLYDWRSIRLVRDAAPAFREWIAEAAEAGPDRRVRGRRPRRGLRAGSASSPTGSPGRGRLVADPVEVFRRADCERLVGLRRILEPLLMRMRGRRGPCRSSRTWPCRPRRWPSSSSGSRTSSKPTT